MALVPDLVRNGAVRFPDRACVIEGERRLSFAEVDRRASALATALNHLSPALTPDEADLLAGKVEDVSLAIVQIGQLRGALAEAKQRRA